MFNTEVCLGSPEPGSDYLVSMLINRIFIKTYEFGHFKKILQGFSFYDQTQRPEVQFLCLLAILVNMRYTSLNFGTM